MLPQRAPVLITPDTSAPHTLSARDPPAYHRGRGCCIPPPCAMTLWRPSSRTCVQHAYSARDNPPASIIADADAQCDSRTRCTRPVPIIADANAACPRSARRPSGVNHRGRSSCMHPQRAPALITADAHAASPCHARLTLQAPIIADANAQQRYAASTDTNYVQTQMQQPGIHADEDAVSIEPLVTRNGTQNFNRQ
ncbi:hypothetical protein AURDEDRAFT_176456 [Auricularia subglabra TFB-10046 SS5]|uniref:Uncharacterized protein n=1 Tax=Auricularia subglabra (strain TFB-10046 / SS5) TaxID=717982 RepID=J0WPY7_AURST|nr:hypothetical protein AURDEDRAFT_176456 [Auricularia subglabra TFB-10046 SS5]